MIKFKRYAEEALSYLKLLRNGGNEEGTATNIANTMMKETWESILNLDIFLYVEYSNLCLFRRLPLAINHIMYQFSKLPRDQQPPEIMANIPLYEYSDIYNTALEYTLER